MVLCTDFGTFGSKICSFLSSTFNQISKQESDIRATPYCMAKNFAQYNFQMSLDLHVVVVQLTKLN